MGAHLHLAPCHQKLSPSQRHDSSVHVQSILTYTWPFGAIHPTTNPTTTMKQSHYTTPRTLADAEFQTWGQAIHGDNEGFHIADKIVMWACAGCAVALAAMVAIGWIV